MEILLLGIYSFFVWLIFIKFKWLPWNSVSQVTVVIIPIVGLTALILRLNIVAPSSHDVRVIKYVVQVIPQVQGRVIEVPAEGNRPMKKGDVLFRIDPTPYELDVKSLEAQLAGAEGSANDLREQLKVAKGNTAALRSQIELTKLRVKQYEELSNDRRRQPLRPREGAGGPREPAGPGRLGDRQRGAGPGPARRGRRRRPRLRREHQGQPRQGALGPVPDRDVRARRRHGDQRAAAARVLRQPHAAGAGHELRRGRVPGHRPVRAERAVAREARRRGRDRARHLSRRGHQGEA